MPSKIPNKRFDLKSTHGSLYYKPLPEILTSVVLDLGEFVSDKDGRTIRRLDIGEIFTGGTVPGHNFTIRRVK